MAVFARMIKSSSHQVSAGVEYPFQAEVDSRWDDHCICGLL